MGDTFISCNTIRNANTRYVVKIFKDIVAILVALL